MMYGVGKCRLSLNYDCHRIDLSPMWFVTDLIGTRPHDAPRWVIELVTAARAWNALPPSVRSAPSPLQFRRDLKTSLFQSSYSSP